MTTDAPTTTAIAPVDLNNPLDSPRALEKVLLARAADDIEPFLAGTGISTERFIRTVIHTVANSPSILQLNGGSIVMAVLEAARMGLEPVGKYGGAYIVPRKGRAVLEVAYNGFIRMAMREGAIARAHAANVYEGDDFHWQEGTDPKIHHVPTRGAEFGDEARGNITHTYAALWYPDANYDFVVMDTAEVDAVRARSDAYRKNSGPWITDDPEMRRKTAVRRLFKYTPAVYNPALQFALEREDRMEGVTVEPVEPPSPRRKRLLESVGAAEPSVPEAEDVAGASAEEEAAAAATDSEEGLPE